MEFTSWQIRILQTFSFVGVVVVSSLNHLFWIGKLKLRRFRCLTHPSFTIFFSFVGCLRRAKSFLFPLKKLNIRRFWFLMNRFSISLNENERCIATHDMSRVQHQGSLRRYLKIYITVFYILTDVALVFSFFFEISPTTYFFFQNRNICRI